MLNFKDFAENILSDLMTNASLSDILLKLKIFASKRGDEELLTWVSNELDGYENKPPKYRILDAGLKVDVFIPFRGTTRIEFPAEMVKEERIRKRLSKIAFHNAISELEKICHSSDDDSSVCMHVPVGIYSHIAGFINGHIQDAYQYTTKAAVGQIIVAVKSVLVDYLLKISNEEDIDFNTFISNNPNMKEGVTINASIVNTGSGTINAQGATNVVGDNNTISTGNKQELLRILAEIDKIAATVQPNMDYVDVANDIRAELQKDKPEKNYLKRCFQTIPSFLSGVGAGIMANGLTPLVKSAIALLL